MGNIRFYLDEDVRPLLADILQERGYDAISAVRLGRIGIADEDHFIFAASQGRALLTFNIRDFIPIAKTWIRNEQAFAGLVVSEQMPLGELLRRTLRLLSQREEKDITNMIVWLSDYR